MALIVQTNQKSLIFWWVREQGKSVMSQSCFWALTTRILQRCVICREKTGTRRKEESFHHWLKVKLTCSLNYIILVWKWSDGWFSSHLKSRCRSSYGKQELRAGEALQQARCLQSPLLTVNVPVLPGKEQSHSGLPAREQLNLAVESVEFLFTLTRERAVPL